ncbi:MAG: Asp-tRNA(Asn)/Glu-tRNA(Gln) amidotransferase subunit GatA [Verrucomicrobiia bacterium]
MSLYQETLMSLRQKLLAQEIQPLDILQSLRKRVEKVESHLQAYTHFDWEKAEREAQEADLSKPLGGIPIAIKDAIAVKDQPLTCSSRLLQKFVSPYDATVIKKLRQAGAYPLGRANMDEFAMGSSTENSARGPTKNPWDFDRIPGGSSGGSAACVAADTAIVSLGSDTGGSIRQPAALCGCVGLKPTYGRVSRYGLVAFASSLDQIGPLGKTVEDTALVLEAIAGHDAYDCTSLKEPVVSYADALKKEDLKKLRVGVPKEYFRQGIDSQVETAVKKAIQQLEDLGATLIEISLPHTDYALSSYYIIAPAEASANLARFDGVRYGARVKDGKDVLDVYRRTREAGFGHEVKRRILLGTYVLSSGYYDAYYLRAQKVRTLIRQDFQKAFEQCDVIVTPTSPTAAFRLGEKTEDPLKMYLADVFTIAVNMAGLCGLSVPCGFVEEKGKKLPVGLQLIGKAFDETTLLQVGHAYEQVTSWRKMKPNLL